MNIKTYIAIAVAALTAACSQDPQNIDVPADENAAAQVELNDDGSVKTESDNGEAADAATAGSAVAAVGQQHQL